MNTKELIYFPALVSAGSFAEAERNTGIARSVLYRYVQKLEDDLGTELFLRTGNHLTLTKTGEIYLNGILRMKDMVSRMYRSLEVEEGEDTIILKIGFTPGMGGRIMSEVSPDLFSAFPNLKIESVEDSVTSLYRLLMDETITTIISVYDSELFPNTKFAQCTEAELLLTLPDNHPLILSKYPYDPSVIYRLTYEDLSLLEKTDFVCSSGETAIGQQIDRFFRENDIHPHILLRIQSLSSLRTLVRNSSFACFFPDYMFSSDNSLQRFRLPVPVHIRGGMFFRENCQPSEAEELMFSLFMHNQERMMPGRITLNAFGKQLLETAGGYHYGNKSI